jgi:hypothetical protein
MVRTVLTPHGAPLAADDRAGVATFHGVKRQDWRARPEAARKLSHKLAERNEVAYWVASPGMELLEGGRADQRGGPRELLRLRSAKLLDGDYRFVCECRIYDRSLTGLRLALARNVQLPLRLAVHIDETGEVRGANVIWRRGTTACARLRQQAR